MTNKNRRTLFLAVLATATLVWSAIYHFGVPVQEMAWMFAYSALGVLAIIVLAAAAVALLQGVKILRGVKKPHDNKDSPHNTQG